MAPRCTRRPCYHCRGVQATETAACRRDHPLSSTKKKKKKSVKLQKKKRVCDFRFFSCVFRVYEPRTFSCCVFESFVFRVPFNFETEVSPSKKGGMMQERPTFLQVPDHFPPEASLPESPPPFPSRYIQHPSETLTHTQIDTTYIRVTPSHVHTRSHFPRVRRSVPPGLGPLGAEAPSAPSQPRL
jgi:hypothetical protein